MPIICVEGLIGSGKSTLLKTLEGKYKIIHEPITQFQTFQKYNPLKIMYQNMSQEAGIVQVHINETLGRHWERELGHCKPGELILSERSLYSTKIFSLTMARLGYLSQFDYDFLANHVDQSITHLGLNVFGADKIFFLDTPASVCYQRIKNRGRTGEKDHCDWAYLLALQTAMQEFIATFKTHKGSKSVKVCQTEDLNTLQKELITFSEACNIVTK